jgi:predicted enzyme related to lactoylglutathione lyase
VLAGYSRPTLMSVPSLCRPVQLKLAVDDLGASVDFYRKALGLTYEVARRSGHHTASAFVFGEYGRDSFFLLWLLDDPDRRDRPGPSNFSLLVDDVDAIHARALAAGATEVVTPHDAEGRPRSSGVKDPSGNWIGLAQAWSGASVCRPVQLKLAVDDLGASVDFYREAFGLTYEVARRTRHHNYSAFVFGEYGNDAFFLLWLLDDPERRDRPGPSNLSLLVDDVDAVHAAALAAGATEVVAPHDADGMPRSSGVTDPSGNWIGLAQG